MRRLLTVALLFLLTSCVSMQSTLSGNYVRLDRSYSVATLAKESGVSIWKLKEANPGKSFRAGEVVMIPSKVGVITRSRAPASSYTPGLLDYIRENVSSNEEYIWPVPDSKRISSEYGRRWGRRHNGIDIPAVTGTKVVASSDGIVVYSGNEYSGYGNIVIISHRDGNFTMYGHNHKNLVRRGDYVEQGDVIALVGSTGRSTGPHLHFEFRKNGEPFNPHRMVARN